VGQEWVVLGAGWVEKFLVQVTECWTKAHELKSAKISLNTRMYWSCLPALRFGR